MKFVKDLVVVTPTGRIGYMARFTTSENGTPQALVEYFDKTVVSGGIFALSKLKPHRIAK